MDIKTAKLGHPLSRAELAEQCKRIYGGVAWPGKNPGFAVVIAMGREKHFDKHDIYLLDEFESFDTRELVRQCGALDFKYRPDRWVGDTRNDAADRFIRELNAELATPDDLQTLSVLDFGRRVTDFSQRRRFSLASTAMLDMEQLYPYVLPQIKGLLDPDRRQLFLKGSKVADYLSGIEPGQIAELQLGDYPAVEALAFAVIEMRATDYDYVYDERADRALAESYAVKSVL